MKITIPQWLWFWRNLIMRFMEDGCLYRASALTYTSLIAIVPLSVVALAILSAFPDFQALSIKLQDFIFENFAPSAGDVVKAHLLVFIQQASRLSAIGISFLVITAVLTLFTIEQAFNFIWRAKDRKLGISIIMLYWAILTLSPFLIAISFMLSSYIFSLPLLAVASLGTEITKVVLSFTIFIIEMIGFSILYIAVPNCHVPVRSGLLGGILAAVLFEIAKIGFSFYIAHFPTYQFIYGTLASIVVFLLWIYLIWLITLLGAEASHLLTFNYSYKFKTKIDGFNHALRWMKYLWDAQQKGRALSLLQLVHLDDLNYEIAPQLQIRHLEKAGFIKKTGNDLYFISADLSQLTLYAFYDKLPWKIPNQDKIIQHEESSLKMTLLSIDADLKTDLAQPLTELFQQTTQLKNANENYYHLS